MILLLPHASGHRRILKTNSPSQFRIFKPPRLAALTAKTIVMFLMMLYARYGAEPGAFSAEFRTVLLRELADMTGMELAEEE
jgi:hypothetical protein